MFSTTNSTTHRTTYELMRDCSMWITNEATKELTCSCELPPMLFVADGDGVAIADLSQVDVSTPEAVLSAVTDVLSEITRCIGGRGAAVMVPGWYINRDDDPEDYSQAGLSLADHPNWEETILLTMVDRDHAESFLASIRQNADDGPQLGEWFPVPNSGLTELIRQTVFPQG